MFQKEKERKETAILMATIISRQSRFSSLSVCLGACFPLLIPLLPVLPFSLSSISFSRTGEIRFRRTTRRGDKLNFSQLPSTSPGGDRVRSHDEGALFIKKGRASSVRKTRAAAFALESDTRFRERRVASAIN